MTTPAPAPAPPSVSAADLRRTRRLKSFAVASLRVAADEPPGDRRSHILNASQGGALVHLDAPPRIGARVEVAIGGALEPAQIVWVCGERAGLRFLQPITAERLEGILEG